MAEDNELTDDVLKMAAFAKALSHPVRVYILKKLAKMDVCCYSGDIAEELQIGRSGLSQHIKELKHAGLIKGHEEKPFIKYCINKENWEIGRKLFHNMFDN
jgi:DNA-binding transcriptional ArsR family regulator